MEGTNGHDNTTKFLNAIDENNNNKNGECLQKGNLWIFGYGSLVWKPGFRYSNFMVGHVKGYKRRFWQGNTVHRGTPEKPGRVVTVVEDEQSETWGLAFQVTDASSALSYLDTRESRLGGYRSSVTTFHPKDLNCKPFQVLMYVGGTFAADDAGAVGDMYLGPASLEDLADQVVSAQGSCGPNVEYLFRLADFMRVFAPGVQDDHLFALEHLVLERLKDRAKCHLPALTGAPTPAPCMPIRARRPNNLAICRVNAQNTHVSESQKSPNKKRHFCLNL